jgi:hypothetical protein
MLRFKLSLIFALPILIGVTVLFQTGCQNSAPVPPEIAKEAPEEPWHTFETEDGRLQVEFPFKPEIQTSLVPSPLGVLDLRMGIAQDETRAFVVTSYRYPVDPADFDTAAALQGGVDGIKGTVQEDEEIEMNGFPGRDLRVENQPGVYTRSRFCIDPGGPTMIQLNVTATNKSELDSDDVNRFFDTAKFSKTATIQSEDKQ